MNSIDKRLKSEAKEENMSGNEALEDREGVRTK
jgi:hypothetical protein